MSRLNMFLAEEDIRPLLQFVIYFNFSYFLNSFNTKFFYVAGKIFTFGDGSKGQLGLGSDLQRSKYPEPVDFFEKIKITKVFCGECHTAFLTGLIFII